MLAKWEERFSIKNKTIDEHHKKLFSLLNSIHDALMNNKSKTIIEPILKELKEYTIYHFKTEEDWMIQSSYPKYQEHKAAHLYFIEKIAEFENQFQQKVELSSIPIEIWIFLKDWLVEHILKMDGQLGPYLSEHGIS